MPERTIVITDHDLERLEGLLDHSMEQQTGRDRAHLRELEDELAGAKVVSLREVPRDAVTMNSRVRILDLESGEASAFTIVFPQDADLATGKISILSPIGTALLGYHVGDTIEWPVPAGKKRIRVEEIIYQPEASGDFHL